MAKLTIYLDSEDDTKTFSLVINDHIDQFGGYFTIDILDEKDKELLKD
jgi:predicted SpoU family rRNA methylase